MSQSQIEFNPTNPEFKNPSGAAQVNQSMRFKMRFSRPSNPSEVFLCITKDGEEEVFYTFSEDSTSTPDLRVYYLDFSVTSCGLYTYHFIIRTETDDVRVGRGPFQNAMLAKGGEWQLTVYDKPQNVPNWFSGGIMYQIFPDRFCIGGERNKTKSNAVYRDDWGGLPNYLPSEDGKILNNDFFGGNILGIIKKLPYLKSLNVTAIYLNPIFEARSNHKYDTGNYRKIDSDFGTLKDFNLLIQKAAKKGIKVILDGVFSHTGDDSIYFNKYGNYDSVGAYQSKDSPYAEFYKIDYENKKYDSWWGVKILPSTNEDNKYFDEFINGEDGIVKYWTDLGIGGWRLDVADELPDRFLDRLHKTVKRSNKDAIIIGEVWEDASNKISYSSRRRYFSGGELDSVTNYLFKDAIINFLKTGKSAEFTETILSIKNNYPAHILNNVMNIIGSHDTARIITVLGGEENLTRQQKATALINDEKTAVRLVKMAALIQFTLPGVPCIYYGDEIGMQGYEDPFNRRCHPWYTKNEELFRFYKKLSKIRVSEKSILSNGEFEQIDVSADGIIAFNRINQKGETITTVVNNSGEDFYFDLNNKSYTDLFTLKPFYGKVEKNSFQLFKPTELVAFSKKTH